jgi:hypothetical protein
MRLRVIRLAALALLLSGLVLGVLAALAPRLGLGAGEYFLGYTWLGVDRRTLFKFGAAVACAGLFGMGLCWAASAGRQHVRSVLANAVLVLCSMSVCLLLLEIAVRVMVGVPVFALKNYLAERNALLTTHTLNQYDPLLGWVLREHQSVSPQDPDGSLTTGERGIRLNASDGAPPVRGAILAAGDSFTAGSEVGDRHSWPAHLEKALGARVINAATGAWGADQIVLRLENLMPALEPRVVIASFLDDDIMRAGFRVYGGANKPYFTVESGALVHHNNPVPRYSGAVAETPAHLVLPSHSMLFHWTADRLGLADLWRKASVSYLRANNEPVEVSCKLLARLKASADRRGAAMLFVMQYPGHPRHGELVRQSHARRVLECSRAAGIRTVDLWDDLVAVHKRSFEEYKGLWVSFDGRSFGHMSSAGNLLVARRLARELAGAGASGAGR